MGGGKQGAGLAITFAEINDPSAIIGDANPDSNNVLSTAYDEDVYDGAATEAIIDFSGGNRTTINDFDQIDISARSLNRIVIGAADIGYNNNVDNSLGFLGSFAIGSIEADTKALVKKTDITGATAVNVNASGEKDGDLDKILSDLGSSNTNKDFDFSGADAMDNTNVHTDDSGSGATYDYSTEGKRIIAVAGAVQAGKKNLGISYAHADVKSETKARLENVNINQSDSAAEVKVNARDDSLLYTVAIGVGVGTGGFSGVGSVAVNRLNNQILAEIGDWDSSDSKGTINASNLSVVAQNDMDLVNVAGSVAVASGQSAATAGGLAVALNLVGTDEHSTKARVSNKTLNVDEDLTVKAFSGTSNDHNLLVGNAIAIGANLGQSGIGFAGAISTSNVDQTIQAAIKDTGTNRTGAASNNSGGDIIVKGQDYTDSVVTAWMGAGSGNGSAGGVAVATNRVDSDVTAEVLGDGSTAGSTTLKAQNVVVDAFRRNWLLTIDAGVAASKQVSLAGSVGTAIIDGDVTARIADSARVDAWNNVLVNADAMSVNLVGSGAVGIGLDAGAGAVAISTAMEYGKTEAFIDDAVVIARGKGGTMSVDTGDLAGYGDLPDLSTAGDENNADAVSMGDLTSGFDLLSVDRIKENVNGLVVNATSRTKQRAITVGGAGGKTVAINANVATNGTYNATKAYIKNADINSGVTDESGADVYVRANAHEAGLAVSAGVAVSGGGEAAGAGVGGFATNAQKRSSEATVVDSTVNADSLTIDANTSKLAQAVSAGVAAGLGATGGLGGAASVVITEQTGQTRAWLRGGVTNANEVVVVADRRQEANVAAGAAGIGTSVGVGIGLAVNLVGGDSKALIGNDLDDSGDTYTTVVNSDAVTVDADRVSSANSYAFGAGLSGGYGVAAMVNTTEFTGETRAAIHGYSDSGDMTTDVRGSDGTSAATHVTVNAQEIQYANQWAAGIGAGASLGVGAVANVVLGRSQVYSEVVGSDIKADTLDLDANAHRSSDLISVAGAASTNAAAAVSIGLALYGQGDTTASDGTNAEDEFDPSRNEANTVLAEDTAGYNRHLSDDDIATIEADSGQTITRSGVPATSTSTESGKSLKLSGESVTAARVSGGVIDVDTLNVNSRTLQHSYQGLGAAQVSSVGIAGVVGISRSYEMNIATVDSDVKANETVVGASIENASDDDGALEMKSFIVGLGGTSVVINYNDARSENRVVAGINSAEGDDTGDLLVTARDATDIRLGDVSSGKPSSVTDGALNINIGAAAVGVSIGYAEKNSDIDAWIGETGQAIDGYQNITLSATNEGMVKSTGFALAGGLLAGVQGVVTDARDNSNVKAAVYGTVDTGSDDSVVNISAQSAPELYSSAYGVTVAAGGAMGGSFAYAITNTKAEAEVADGVVFNGTGDVVVRSETGSGDAGYETAYAAAFAASGGLLAGIAGSEARSTNKSQSVARVGDGVYLPYADFAVYSRHTGVQIADADGYFVGLVAGGYQTGITQSFTSSRVEFGKDPIAALERTGSLTLDASSVNQNQSFTTAGGGGYYAGSAAESVMESGDHSNGNYAAAVLIDDWASGYRTIPVDASSVHISATNETEFFTGTDSTTVSVVGGSGATSTSEVDTNAKVELGENVSFSAFQIDIDAVNRAHQIQSPYFSDFNASVYGAGGGAANGSAGLSYQNLKNLTAEVIIGKGSVLQISDLAWLDTVYDHSITIDANTDFYVYDESRLEIGGALQGAGAESDVDVKARNKITLGENVKVQNPVGEIGIGTFSKGSAVAQANVSVWAAAGVAGGVSEVDLDIVNQINIGKNALLNAYGDVGIYSGRGSDYFRENQLVGTALANVYNWTAIPIPAGNKAKSNITLNNNVDFSDGFDIGSDSHVFIEANEGQVSASHRGVEKNPYLELFSAETSFGSSSASASNILTFNGSGSVVAGQYSYQWVEVEENGTITSQLYRYGSAAQMAEQYSSRAELQAYIDELNAEIAELEAWQPGDEGTPDEITDGSDEDGVADPDANPDDPVIPDGSADELVVDNSNPYQTRIDELKAEVVLLTPILDDLSENPNYAIEVKDIRATAGNVNLVADTIDLLGSQKPTFTAKGDAYIKVENKTDKHLVLDNLSITNQTGGNVFVTGGASLSSSYISELSGTETGIVIRHDPTGSNYLDSDVIINGDIANLLSSITIDVLEGDLIQQATIEANAINIDVKNGSLLLNSDKPQTYGRDPDALVNYTSGWKPGSPDDFVQLYINEKYSTAIKDTGIDDFNNWFTGRAIRHTGDQISYYQNSSSCKSCDYGYDEMNIYFNWGFSNSEEYTESDAIVFEMRSNSSSRGGSKWKFKPVENKQSALKKTATYTQVDNSLSGNSAVIVGEKVVINAERLDINGEIIVGKDNTWSVDVGSDFDSKIAEYIRDAGLTAGDVVKIKPGETKTLWVQDSVLPYLKTKKTYSFDVSSSSGSGIGLTYDVATGNLTADDIPVSGGGYIAIRAKISSTGEDGKITVRDGLGQIDINNDSSSQLVLGTISAGDDATGIIRITDLNKKKNIPNDGRGYKVEYSEWFVHSPGNKIKKYETSAWDVGYDDADFVGEFGGTGETSTTTYDPVKGQLYYIREGRSVKRTFDRPDDGYFAKYPTTVGDWEFDGGWNVEYNDYTSCKVIPEACTDGTATNYLSHHYTNSGSDIWRSTWWLSYDKYYGSNMTNVDPMMEVARRLDLDAHTYIKADHSIDLQFTGKASGSIDLTSKSNINLTGNIYNPSGTTNISTQKNLITSGSTAITSDVLTLSAKGSIGSLSNPLSIITDELGMISTHGSLFFNVTGADGDIDLQHLKAKYDIVGVFDKGITAKNASTIIQADTLDLTSRTGGIGQVGTIGNTGTYEYINLSTTGTVKLNAATDIAVNQASGDLELHTANASEEVVIKLGNGRLINGIGRLDKTDEELAYDAEVWDKLHLLDDDAGKVTVSSYENQFTHKYHTYWLLKQRVQDDSDASFTLDPAYIDALRLRYEGENESISDVELTSRVKADYQGLHQWFDDQVVAAEVYINPEEAKGVEQKGTLLGYDYGDLLTGTYDQNYQLDLDENSTWYTNMVDGAKWKQSQLDISISSTALNGDASSQLSNRDSNITASDVHLLVSAGSVGENLSDLVFSINRDGSGSITDAQKSALLAAGAGDIATNVTDNSITFNVKQVDPIKLTVTGDLYAAARDEVYIESTTGLTLGQISSASNDVRLVVDGAIGAKSNLTNISARDLFISNTQGNIGSTVSAVRLDLSGALRQAGAASDMHLHNLNGDLYLGAVSAGGLLSIYNNNDLLSYSSDSFISADTFDLDVNTHSLGSNSTRLNLIMTGAGGFNTDAGNAWLNVKDTSLFTLTDIDIDNRFDLFSTGGLDIQGDIQAQQLILDVDGAISSGHGHTLTATGNLDLDASSMDLAGITVAAGTASFDAQSGGLKLEDITATTGGLTLLATGQIDLIGNAKTSAGDIQLDAQNIVMTDQAKMNSSGQITMTATESMTLFNLTAESGKVKLTTSNAFEPSYGAITADSITAKVAEIDAQTVLTLGNLNVTETATLSSGSDAVITANSSSTGDFRLTSLGDITLSGDLTSQQGSIILKGQKNLYVYRRIEADRNIEIDVVEALTVDAAQIIASGEKATLKAGSIQMADNSRLDIEGNLEINTGQQAELFALDITGAAMITTGAGLTIDGPLKANSLNLNNGDNVVLNGVSTISTGFVADVDGNFTANQSVTVGDDLEMIVDGDITFDKTLTTSNGFLNIQKGNSLTLKDDVSIATTATAVIDNAITLATGKTFQSVGNTTLNAKSVDFQSGSTLDVDGDLSIATTEQAALFTVDVEGHSQLTTGNNLTVNGSLEANSLNLDNGGNVVLNGASTISTGFVADVDGDFTANQSVTVGDDLEMTVDGDITFDKALTTSNGFLNIKKGNSLTLKDDVSIATTATAVIDNAITLATGKTFQSIGNTTLNAKSVDFQSGSTLDVDGDLSITTTEQAALFAVDVEGHSQLTTGNNLTVNGALEANSLNLNNGDNVVLNGVSTISTGFVADVDGNFTANQSVTVGDDLEMTVDGDITFDKALTTSNGFLNIKKGNSLNLNDDVSIATTATAVIDNAITLATGKTFQSIGNTTLNAKSVDFQSGSTLDVDGDLSITTTEQAALFAVDVEGHSQLTTGNNLTVNGALEANSLNLNNGGNVVLNGASTISTGFVADVDGDFTANQSVTVGDDLEMTVDGDITFDKALTTSNGFLNIKKGNSLTLNDDVSIGTTTTAVIDNTITLATDKTFQSVGNTTLNAKSVDFQSGSTLDVDGDLSLTTTEQAALFTVDVEGHAQLTTGNNLTVNGSLETNSLNLNNGGNVVLNGASTISTGFVADVDGNFTANQSVTVGDDLDMTVDGDITFDKALTTINGFLNIKKGNSLIFNDDVTIGSSATIDVANEVELAADKTFSTVSFAKLNAGSLIMGSTSELAISDDLDIFTESDQELATLTVGGNLSATSKNGAIRFNESADVAGDIELQASKEVLLVAQHSIKAASLTIGSEAVAGAASFSMAENSLVSTDDAIVIHTSGDQLIGQLHSNASNEAFFLKSSVGAINGRSDLDLVGGEKHLIATQRVGCDQAGRNCSGAQGIIQAATGIGDPLVIDLPWLSAQTDSGDINILATSDLHANLLKATNGNIYMTTLGYLEIDELIGTPWLLVNDFLFADQMTLDKGGISSRESIHINQVNMTTSGPLALYAPDIQVNINGGDQDETLMALGGFNEVLTIQSDARSYYQNLESKGFVPTTDADNVVVNLTNSDRLHITHLLTKGGELQLAGNLLVDQAEISAGSGYNFRFTTNVQSQEELVIDLNNSNGGAIDVDGQFMTPYGSFWMDVDGVSVTTNTQFTRYRQPLLLTYKSLQNDPQVTETPESFYRLSVEYSNDINNQLTSNTENSVLPPVAGEEEVQLIAIADDWLGNLESTAAGNNSNQKNESEEDEIWFTVTPDKTEES